MVGVAELMAPGKVKIMPIKVLGAKGGGSTTAINKGIRWAIKNGADVISMSLGGAMDFSDFQKSGGAVDIIIREAVEKGNRVVVVAAGNENCPIRRQVCSIQVYLAPAKSHLIQLYHARTMEQFVLVQLVQMQPLPHIQTIRQQLHQKA